MKEINQGNSTKDENDIVLMNNKLQLVKIIYILCNTVKTNIRLKDYKRLQDMWSI